MTGGSHIRAVGPEGAQEAQGTAVEGLADDTLALDEEWQEDWVEDTEDDSVRSHRGWILPSVALLALVGWTGFFGWAFRDEILAGGTAQQWVGWIINWSVPVLLIVSVWLLAMRHSRREAVRFADAAAALARESQALEGRLVIVNRELSLAREFLGAQSRDLESLGRVASERISTHASELQSLIHSNGAQVDSIASVSTTALENMQKLRDDLPVISNSAKDVSNQVGNAGRTAHEQLEKLVAGFERLNQFGLASGKQVDALSAKVETTITAFEEQVNRLDGIATERFDALKEKSEDFRVDLDSREIDALAAMRHRADELRSGLNDLRDEFAAEEDKSLTSLRARLGALRGEGETLSAKLREAEDHAFAALRQAKDRLHEEIVEVIANLDDLDAKALAAAQARVTALHEEAGRFDDLLAARDARFNEEIARRQDQFDTRETQASEALAQRMADLDDALTEREQAQIAQAERLAGHGAEIADKVEQLNTLFASVSAHASEAETRLSSGLTELDGRLAGQKANLDATERALSALTDSSIRLLEIIQSGARQTGTDLPKAIDAATATLGGFEDRAIMLRETLDDAGKRGAALSNYLITTQGNVEQVAKHIDNIHARQGEHSRDALAQLSSLQEVLGELEKNSERLTTHTSEKLQASIKALLDASHHAFTLLESNAEEVVDKAAQKIGSLASDAVQRSLRENSGAAIEDIEAAATKASQRGREIAIQLRDQLAKVNELAGNLEQRVTRAREIAEEQVDHDFARRMALITDSLNSNAIDIMQAMSRDVTDTEWASYLKGDRGIFTRRAVRLLDNSESREIVNLYESDENFREHVSRYIHDFEAMLRSLLSTRDGNALGVTILSSDMGKLYVALAQAIERLRN
ncbi:ATPase [Altererythrobacter arenosus]|uniref:ATPase n=1 Tax=Altererythrobacter arenosus TaxID=3032592 RepID=A0ABY8FYQ4_9SPHN|nr:ATPase [Altererythrobacter sp. CAU 1644]WFL77134.1 ATPase [Altererythrobacter sp. CAU 1644]